MTGAGNDFIVINKIKNKGFSPSSELISYLCDRRIGIGADGLILLSASKKHDFKMEYFNADGLPGSLCGNGARCAIKFAGQSNLIKNGKANFSVNQDEFSGELLNNDLVRFDLKPPGKIKLNFKIKAYNQLIRSNFANTGSPHVVIEIEDVLALPKDINSKYNNIENVPVHEIGREIRYHKDFAPEGTNVNFIQIKNDVISIRTYERGVENETLACGTGSVAAAVISSLQKGLKSPIKLLTKSGDELLVNFDKVGDRFEKVSLTGPANIVFTGELESKEI